MYKRLMDNVFSDAKWISMPVKEIKTCKMELDGHDMLPLPIFRHTFNADESIERATAYLCGLGQHELYINGHRIGENIMEPGWTNYRKTCLYSSVDVTAMLCSGENAVGIMLGNGMYNVTGGRYTKFTGSFGQLKLVFRLDILYTNGSSMEITSGEGWRVAYGPVVFSCIYGGEDYDARREKKGWDCPGYTEDGDWTDAYIVEGPGGELRPRAYPPIKVMERIKPIQIARIENRRYIVDFGQNLSGWSRIKVRGSAGSYVKLWFSEVLKEGLIFQKNSGAPCYFTYILKGDGEEAWSPRFTYTGFRYALVEGAEFVEHACPTGIKGRETMNSSSFAAGSIHETDWAYTDALVLLDIEAQMIYPDIETTGSFECSEPLYNSIHRLINRAVLSNMKSIFTDCPHREKLGWLEQAHLMAPSIMYNYDVHDLFVKCIMDMGEAQLDNGLVPSIAPEYPVFKGEFRDSPEWGSACIITPWYVYREYGDKSLLKESYDVMRKYMIYLSSMAKGHLLNHGLGDWCDIGPNPPYPQNTPIALTATAIYYYDAVLMQKIATVLGRQEDAGSYGRLACDIRQAFNMEFFNVQELQYSTGSQTANAMPLALGLVDEEYREALVEKIIEDIQHKGFHTTSGDIGYRYLLLALAENGSSDVIAKMLLKIDTPSYGFQVEHGATTLTEMWDGPERIDQSSQNHLMLGHAEEWFYRYLAGIDYGYDETGMYKITVKPHTVRNIKWVKASRRVPGGCAEVNWQRGEDGSVIVSTSFVAAEHGCVQPTV